MKLLPILVVQLLIRKNAMIFWQEVHYEVLQDIKRLMKLHSLVQRVAMSSQQFFIYFKHGERLSYAVYLMDSLQRRHDDSTELFVMYDIACSLQKHLKHCGRNDLLEKVFQ